MKKTKFCLLLTGCLLLSGCSFKFTNDSRSFGYKIGVAGIEVTCAEQPSTTEISIDNPGELNAKFSIEGSDLKSAAKICQDFLDRNLKDPK